jgi:hypothetical protein
MMNWLSFVYVAVLFFLLTPGILVSLPPKSSKWVVALVHAIVYTVILTFTYHPVAKLVEGFKGNHDPSENCISCCEYSYLREDNQQCNVIPRCICP